jgi:NADPH:quinone reductase-like Zn-dependent oxidoreductase
VKTETLGEPAGESIIKAPDVETMTAIVHDKYGTVPDEILRLAQVARPTVGDDEVLVAVQAASIDRGTWHILTGLPYPIRLAGFGVRKPKQLNPGRSLAGTVHAVGTDVTGFSPGDEVYGIAGGTFAQFVAVRTNKLAAKPANLSFDEAAAVPISSLTALQAVRDHGRVQAGENVLIIGASGGVGTFAVQIAKALGAEVTGVCSTSKVDLVRSIGADHVLDYTDEDFAAGEKRYDVILDIGGNASLSRLRHALAAKGRLVIVGGETDGRWLGGSDRQIRAIVLSAFVGQKLTTFVASENAGDLAVLTDLIEAGKLTPIIDRTYPLRDVPAAIQYMAKGQARGKVVINV